MTLTKEQKRVRWGLYEKGLCDKEMSKIIGVTPIAIQLWRRKRGLKCNPSPSRRWENGGVPIGTSLTEDEQPIVKDFWRFMLFVHDKHGVKDVGKMMSVWRAGVGR